MIIEIVIFITVVFITSLYFAYKQRLEYYKSFERRNIPGPKPGIFLGNFREIKQYQNKNDIIEKWVRQYGDIMGYYLGTKRYVIVNDLDMINQVFIKNVKSFYNRENFALDAKYLIDSVIALKNQRWAKVRKILTPIFSYSKVNSGTFDSEIKDCVHELHLEISRRIRESKLVDLKNAQTAEIDIHELSQAFTLDVISRTSFGLQEKVYEPNNNLMNCVKEYFQIAANVVVELGTLIPAMKSILTFVNNNLSSGRLVSMMTVRLKEHINSFLKEVQNKSTTCQPAQETKTKFAQDKARVLVSLMKKLANRELTENEFIGNILLILLAGYETTANSVTNALYLLAKHPEIQAKLREEIKEDGVYSKYLDNFWLENLRYYPPVTFFVTRQANEDCIINGVQFLESDIVQAPVWLIHRNPDYWHEPEVFRPERFEPDERKSHHPCQFLTYGLGPKICLGMSFANYEAKTLLINVLKEFKWETCKDTPDPLEFKTPTVINNPTKPVILKFIKLEEQK